MKVLHFQHMGVGVILCEALRELGVESRVLATAPHPFGFKEDFLFSRKRVVRKYLRRYEWRKYHRFNILHSHDPHKLPDYVLNHWRGRMVQHYHGTQKPLYDVPSFVSLPSILKAVPDGVFLPLPVNTNFFKPLWRMEQDTVSIGFCDQTTDPTKAKMIPKNILSELARKNDKAALYPINSIIPHYLMPNYYRAIDIWVDRFGLDFYGFGAVEAASMGIPVIAQIGEEELSYVPDCPFINTTREGLEAEISSLVEDKSLRKALGAKARVYAMKHHEAKACAEKCLKVYRELSNE